MENNFPQLCQSQQLQSIFERQKKRDLLLFFLKLLYCRISIVSIHSVMKENVAQGYQHQRVLLVIFLLSVNKKETQMQVRFIPIHKVISREII